MLPVTIRRVLLAEYRVDFRKQLNGLLGEAYGLGAAPYDGDCVVFVKKDWTQLRALVGDHLGLYLVSRRFEGGRLSPLLSFAAAPSSRTVSTAELALLLEGAHFTVHRRPRACREKANAFGRGGLESEGYL
jgi:IS66 Orf2 like protein